MKNRAMIVKNVALQRQRRNAVHLIAIRDGGAPDPAKMKETMLRYGLIPVVPT